MQERMNITANTPRPKSPKRQGPNIVSWIFFLMLALGPLRGIVRSLLPAWISDSQLLIMVLGVFALAVMVSLVARAFAGRSDAPRVPTIPGSSGPRPQMSAPPRQRLEPARLPSSRSPSGYPGPPRFEPIITGKVLLAGFVVAVLLILLLFLIVILLGIR